MIDTDFERKAALMENAGYFDRVRQLCAEGMSVESAWMQTESELPFGLRRFTNIISFHAARKKEAAGILPKPQFKVV